MGKAPTLACVGNAFAYGTALSWIGIQLWDLAEFSGCRSKMTEQQIEELSQLVCSEYGYLKLTELMDFFRRFKSGEFGKFYGAVDPIVISCALREYCDIRDVIIAKLKRQEEERQRQNDPNHLQWLRKYKRNCSKREFYSMNFRSTDFSEEEFSEIWWLFNLGYERANHGYIG